MFVGNVEARLMCFYRRSEVPASLVHLADKHHWAEVDVEPVFLFNLLFLFIVILFRILNLLFS